MKEKLTETMTDVMKKLALRGPVQLIPQELMQEPPALLDLTEANTDLQRIDVGNPEQFTEYVFHVLNEAGTGLAVGRYDEDRTIYRHSSLFDGDASAVRSVHLGLDLWAPAGTAVYPAFSGTVHSFQDNRGTGDYGPTIILEHQIEGYRFYTLYGHLSRSSLEGLAEGKYLAADDVFAAMGSSEENGRWPPHLHFQVIGDLQGKRGDYPGVCAPKDRREYLENCPNPNLLLQFSGLS
ncbi:MAG: peptidoglycan DD-metalloendopeptidase family protein [Spirochaetia bacterium]|nr:peptidoglycan DD-metalloendopeptidase family protein [Spirochaetia bacterium]